MKKCDIRRSLVSLRHIRALWTELRGLPRTVSRDISTKQLRDKLPCRTDTTGTTVCKSLTTVPRLIRQADSAAHTRHRHRLPLEECRSTSFTTKQCDLPHLARSRFCTNFSAYPARRPPRHPVPPRTWCSRHPMPLQLGSTPTTYLVSDDLRVVPRPYGLTGYLCEMAKP